MTTIAETGLTPGSARERTLFGHPVGLTFLFLTEMWERFSYYGMRALLVLYMTKHILQPDQSKDVLGYGALASFLSGAFGAETIQQQSSQIYGLYTALVYMTPFFGGILADRVLGQRKSVFIGGVLMAIGHFLMAFEAFFLIALFFLILGNGCFKPNISTQIGNLYKPEDPRRDRAYSIFYVGINLGAFFSPLVCGTLGEIYGWHYGFGAAGVGMVLGLIVFSMGGRYLPPDTLTRGKQLGTEEKPLDASDKSAVRALIIIAFLSLFFWATFEQQGNTISLWADGYTDRMIGGWEFPATWVQAINPLVIMLATPLVVGFWAWQSARGREPSTVVKMAIGCGLVGVSYLVMIGAALEAEAVGKAGIIWLWLNCSIATFGELYLSPMGLSLFNRVAPLKIASMMMAVWLAGSFGGNFLQGWLGSYFEVMPKTMFWLMIALVAFAAAGAFFMLKKPLDRILHARLARA